MIRLEFVSCLTSAPIYCKRHSAPLPPDAGVGTSMRTAQARLAEWSGTHPAHQIRRWGCIVVGDGPESEDGRPHWLQELIERPPSYH